MSGQGSAGREERDGERHDPGRLVAAGGQLLDVPVTATGQERLQAVLSGVRTRAGGMGRVTEDGRRTAPLALSLPLVLTSAVSDSAAPSDKPQALSSWTQTSASSYNAWVCARNNQGAWAAYGFDWTTDHCSTSPDNPFGFPFRTACVRHAFGYRNHKAADAFSAGKSRIGSSFYEDLKRVCAACSGATRTSCDGTAWTYYHAVDIFGVAPVRQD